MQTDLRNNFGMTFKDNPIANARLSNGLSTVALEDKREYAFGLKTESDLRKFEEMNGFSLTPDINNLNQQSKLEMMQTLGNSPHLSNMSWNPRDLVSRENR